MLYREIIAVCSKIHTKHINTAVWAERGSVTDSLSEPAHLPPLMHAPKVEQLTHTVHEDHRRPTTG